MIVAFAPTTRFTTLRFECKRIECECQVGTGCTLPSGARRGCSAGIKAPALPSDSVQDSYGLGRLGPSPANASIVTRGQPAMGDGAAGADLRRRLSGRAGANRQPSTLGLAGSGGCMRVRSCMRASEHACVRVRGMAWMKAMLVRRPLLEPHLPRPVREARTRARRRPPAALPRAALLGPTPKSLAPAPGTEKLTRARRVPYAPSRRPSGPS